MSGFVDAYSGLETEGLGPGEEPWCDLMFDMVDKKVAGAKSWLGQDERSLQASAMASTPRGDIGFTFEMEPVAGWRRQEDDQLKTEWGCITLRSLGAPTDLLLREYQNWFGLEADGSAVKELKAAAVIIAGSAARFETDRLNTKLFLHHAEDDETYAEVYLNLDAANARVELKEKDEEYRPRLVGWLQGRFGQPDLEWLR